MSCSRGTRAAPPLLRREFQRPFDPSQRSRLERRGVPLRAVHRGLWIGGLRPRAPGLQLFPNKNNSEQNLNWQFYTGVPNLFKDQPAVQSLQENFSLRPLTFSKIEPAVLFH